MTNRRQSKRPDPLRIERLFNHAATTMEAERIEREEGLLIRSTRTRLSARLLYELPWTAFWQGGRLSLFDPISSRS